MCKHALRAYACWLLVVIVTYLSDGSAVGVPQAGADALGHSLALSSAAATPGCHGAGRGRCEGSTHASVLEKVATCEEWHRKRIVHSSGFPTVARQFVLVCHAAALCCLRGRIMVKQHHHTMIRQAKAMSAPVFASCCLILIVRLTAHAPRTLRQAGRSQHQQT